jgi:mannosyltransferase OCH1-like enzyme
VVASTAPTPSATGIPEKLWYKLGPKGLSYESKQWIGDCLTKNPTYRFEVLTDGTDELYVKKYYAASRPDIVETYLAIPIPILKSDFLRYLILYNDGGIWSDLDVSCEDIPIQEWIPAQYRESTGLVVGLEFDWAWENDNFLHSQFASWTVMAKPRSPHMLVIINDILEDFRQKCKEHNVELPDLKLDMVGEVVDITGPKRMTRGIVKSLELILNVTIDDRYDDFSLSIGLRNTTSQLL